MGRQPGAVEGSLRSFQPLTDPAALNLQPQHIDIVVPTSATTIADLLRTRPSPLSADALALVNQVEANTRPLPAGKTVKWVVRQPLPTTTTN